MYVVCMSFVLALVCSPMISIYFVNMSKKLQIRTEPEFEAKLRRVAKSKGLSVSAYVRTTIIEAVERASKEDAGNGLGKKTEK